MTMLVPNVDEPAQMPAYEREQWARLQDYWAKRADARGTPAWLAEGAQKTAESAAAAGRSIVRGVPAPIKKAATGLGDTLLDHTLRPTADAALHLLDLAKAWAVELHDPAKVITSAREAGLAVEEIADLRQAGLKDCDRLLTRHSLKWRTVGAIEGAATGALALVPVAGMPVSVMADVVVMDVLCASIATRVAYSYGFDARDLGEQQFIEAIVSTALTKHLAKAAPLNKAQMAHQAFHGRQKWSPKLRADHRLGRALEQFMQRWYHGGHVPVQHVGKALGVVAIALGAGTNSHTLARVADHSRKYCQTRWLCERYALPLPPSLSALPDVRSSDAAD